MIRATDKKGDFSSVIERTLDGELKGEQHLLYEPQFVCNRFHETERGAELVLEYFSQVAMNDKIIEEGEFFPTDRLPEGTLKQYYEIIPMAAEALCRRNYE